MASKMAPAYVLMERKDAAEQEIARVLANLCDCAGMDHRSIKAIHYQHRRGAQLPKVTIELTFGLPDQE